jgi:hypothetical protein
MATRLYDRVSQAFPQRAVVRLDGDDFTGNETQRHLVSALTQLGATGVDESADAAELHTRLRVLLGAGPVLLFVDNAWTPDQLDGLLPTSFHTDSRLIITSRFAELGSSTIYRVSGLHSPLCWVLRRARVCLMDGTCARRSNYITIPHPQALAPKLLSHEMELLSEAASRELFRRCAGRQGVTDAGPGGLEDELIRACGGLPLALELAGGVLWREGDVDVWQVCSAQIWLHATANPAWILGTSHSRPNTVSQATLSSFEGLAAGLPDANTEDKLRGVLAASFNALSLTPQNMVGTVSW